MLDKYHKLTYKEQMAIQYSYLDKIDFQPYIDKYEDLDDLWYAVEDDYDDTEITRNDFLQGWIFNWLDHYELSLYIERKYGVRYREETITTYHR